MPLVFGGDASNGYCRDSFWVEDDPSEEIVVFLFLLRDISLSGYKDSFLRIVGSEYYWELCVVDPSPLPIYFWLCGSKPWIPEDGFLFSEFREIESEVGTTGSCLNL